MQTGYLRQVSTLTQRLAKNGMASGMAQPTRNSNSSGGGGGRQAEYASEGSQGPPRGYQQRGNGHTMSDPRGHVMNRRSVTEGTRVVAVVPVGCGRLGNGGQ